jgi:hypothetical protein
MQSRAARLTCSAVAWLAIGSAAAFLIYSENRITERQATTRTFELRAREAIEMLADVRAAQQAYVAAGQGVTYWVPRAAGLDESISQTLASLRATASSAVGSSALDEAADAMTAFNDIDKRARDYIKSGQPLMAGDVIFTEGSKTLTAAAGQIESARRAEEQALDASEAARRKQEAAALAAAAAYAGLALVLLIRVPHPTFSAAGVVQPLDASSPGAAQSGAVTTPSPEPSAASDELLLRESPRRAAPMPPAVPARTESPLLKAAAKLCTEFTRVTSSDDMTELLGQVGEVIDASGLIVWLGSTSGADLRPVLAHGYSAQALERMPTVPRSANNAAAAAYRSGTLQIVLARPGASPGALVAPLLSPEGCIGALSAEISHGGETSDGVQALATIFAAQLAAALVVPLEATESKTAASG